MSTNDLQKVSLDWTLDLDGYAKAISFQFYNPEITLFYSYCKDYHIVRKITIKDGKVFILKSEIGTSSDIIMLHWTLPTFE